MPFPQFESHTATDLGDLWNKTHTRNVNSVKLIETSTLRCHDNTLEKYVIIQIDQ
jgi:hypothetical protein